MSAQDSGDKGSYTEAVGTRLTPQTMESFESYRDENELGNSEALRRLVRDALDDDTVAQRQPVAQLATAFGAVYVAIYLLGNQQSLIPIFGVFLVILLFWAASPRFTGE